MSENAERNAERVGTHPDLADLEALRTGEAGGESGGEAERLVRHLDSCERCRAVARELDALAPVLADAARAAGPDEPVEVPVDVPVELDADIRVMARECAAKIAGRRRRRRKLTLVRFSWPGWVAAAAAVLLVAGLFAMRATRESQRTVTTAMDIDRSGGVDIVDAYLMSRRLRKRDEVPDAWDFDRDGRVGEADVRAVAARAVALAGGGI